ncbi:MAG: MFS transporter [Actinobacteria bacterium]|nr:MFS transporter [Actinomycetota bacterium]
MSDGPRLLVPTERQRTVGDEGDYRDLAYEQPQVEAPARRLRGMLLRDLDPRTLEGPKLALLVLCLTSLFARVDEQALGVLLPQIRSEFGVNLGFLAALSSLVGILAVLANLPAGYLADRIKRVRVVGVGTVLTGLTVLGQGFCPGVGSLVAVRLANGFAQGIAPPASFSLQTDLFPPATRSRVFSLFFAAAQAGLILGPIAAGLLGDRYGWRPTLLALGALATLAGLLVFLLREPVRGAMETDLPPGEALTFSQAYRAAASIRTVRRCWYATPLLNVRGVFTFLVLPSFFAEVYQFSTLQVGLLVALSGLSGLVGLLIAGALGDRVLADRPGRYMVVMGLVTALQASLLVLLSFSPGLVVAIVATQGAVVIETALQPAFYTLISLVVPVRLRGLGLATNAPWQVLGLVGAPFVVSVVEDIGLQRGVLVFVPILLLGGLILATGASGVEADIRAVRAADVAASRSRDDGPAALLVCRDVDVAYDGVAAAGVVMMPGGAAVFPSLSVAENLRAAAWTLQDEPAAVALRTAEVLELFPVLRDRLDSPAGALSGGEQQMVGLSQALLMDPELLMVDELSLGLAPRVVEQLLDVLRTLNARGTTIVMVEQSLNVALTIADRAVFMEKGTVRFSGPTQELLARPDLVRSVFMGGASGGTRTARRKAPETSTATALDVDRVQVQFGGVAALTDVSLTVSPGQVLGIIGPNGAGKTTLFDVISGFVSPAAGTVRIAGTDVTGTSPDTRARLGLGRSFQNARLFPALTVRENIAVALERRTVRNPVLGALWAPQVRTSERRIGKQVDRTGTPDEVRSDPRVLASYLAASDDVIGRSGNRVSAIADILSTPEEER